MFKILSKKEDTVKRSVVFKSYLPYLKKYKASLFSMFFFGISWNLVDVFFPLYFLKLTKNIEITPNFSFEQIKPMFVVLVLLMISRWVMRRIEGFIGDDFYSKIGYDIRVDVFSKIIRKTHNFFVDNFTGSLLNKINRYVGTFYNVTTTFFEKVLPFVFKIFGIIVAISFINGFYSKVLIIFAIFFTLTSYWAVESKRKLQIDASKAETVVSGAIADSISNQSSVQLFNSYQSELESIKISTAKLRDLNRKNWFSWLRISAYQSLIAMILNIYVLFHAFKDLETGVITLAALFIIRNFADEVIQRLWDISGIIRNLQEGFGQAHELVEAINTTDNVLDKKDAIDLKQFKKQIEFENVNYEYENNNKKVLDNFNLSISAKQKVGLVGLSGGGKSTIVKLLLRLFDVTAGSIKIDGKNLRDISQGSLREIISFVPQDTSLFHRSIIDNIRYGKPNATDEEVYKAAKKAHIHDFVIKLPEGYKTLVGERGVKLSGGERQRITIARAILKNAPILVLDEATSSLDSETEKNIQEALDELMKGKTVIAIAHRLSTIRKMDRIIVLEDGKIAEDGNHEDLLTNETGTYKKLWDMQAGGFIKEEEIDELKD